MINKAKRILAFFIVLVMLSGMIGTDNIMKLTIYAEDAVEQVSAEEQSGEGTASTEATPAPAETPVPVETPAPVETAAPDPEPVVQGTENENVGTDTLPAEEETTGTESTADDSARQPVETKKPEKAKTPKEPYDHKVEKIKVIPDLEMSLSGILPDTVTVRFEKTKYEMEQDDKIILYMAEIHVYDESGKEFKPTGEITVELKGDLIRKAIEQEKTFGLIVNEKDKEAEFIKAKKDTMTFRIKEFDLFVLYELVPVIDTETETAASDGQPVQTEPATTETETGATETEQDVTETETDAAETETVVPEAENPVSETEEPEASPAPILSEEEAEENDGEEEPATEPASDAAEPENAEEDEAEEKELSYCFASTEDALMLLAFLTEHGFDFESIAEVQISEGEETSVEIEECEGDRKLIPTEHFDRLILNILIDEETSICVVLSYPSAELVENTLTPEIPGEATMTITGLIPEGSTAEATPVEVSIDGNDALAAYDIDIFAPETEGEEIWQPGEGETVTVEMYDPSFEGLLYVYHMEDENSEPELVACVEANDGEISFEAASFSVYVIVPAPDPIPGGGEIVQNTSELALNYSRKFRLSVHAVKTNQEEYFTNGLNGNGAFITTTQAAAASTWSFEPAGADDTYYIFTVIDEVPQYMVRKNLNSVEMELDPTNKTAFLAVSESTGRLSLKVVGTGDYLQYSNGGSGIRLYSGNSNNNSKVRLTYADNPGVEGDPYELDGATYGLMRYNGETSAYAMMAQIKTTSGTDRLASKSLLIRHDPMNQSNILYVSKDSDATLWTFHWVEEDIYYLTAGDQYVRVQGSNVTLSDTADDYCRIRVIPGSGDKAGRLRLLGVASSMAIGLNNNAANGFGGSNNNGNNEWLSLMELSAYGDEDFVMYSAVKVGVSDNLNVKNGNQVVIYTRVWNEQSKSYEFYAIDHNGDLVPCYESGESIVWIGSQINTLLWNFTEYYYAGTTTPNYYYEFQNDYTGKYLAPQISGGQIMSDSTIGVNLNGRRYGDYYSTILAWDDPHYDYAGLKTENGHIVSCPMAQAETFYFAVMQLSEDELTPVATVDHSSLGLVMKMVDFNGEVVSGGSGTSPSTKLQTDVMGTRAYTEGNTQPGLLSTNLEGSTTGYPKATITGRSLSELFDGATTVNHLFIQSIYDGSGYYEFDSTQNFAHLNGSNFEVYHELGTVGGTADTRKHGQFMPYNSLKPGIAHSENPQNLTNILAQPLSENYPRKYETLYGFNEPDDHYFGMEIEGHFMQTPNGYDAWGHDIIFEFVGDDDFWLYVDGELVIDLGGIHKALAGSVNYSTGKVSVNGVNTTLYDLFKQNYMSREGITDPNDPAVTAYLNGIFTTKTVNNETCRVFKDYSTHTVRIFYMERGAGASNLRMRFNLATVNPGQVLLSKEIVGTDKQDYASVKFPFQIYYDNGEGEQLLQPRQNQATSQWNVVYQNSSEPVEYAASVEIDHVTYTDVFYLKPGQTAEIKMPDDTVTYRIRECGVNTTIYDQVTFNGEDAIELKPEGTSETSSYFTSSATQEERASVTFSNHVDQSALRTLLITKKLFDEAGNPLSAEQDNTPFQFRLSLGEDLYRNGTYYVRNPEGYYCYYDGNAGGFISYGISNFNDLTATQRQQAAVQSSPNGAISKIMSGYSVEVRDLLVGTEFFVEERFGDNPLGYDLRTWTENGQTYYGYKRVEGSYIIEEGDTQNSGVIRDNSNPHIEIHNQRGWGIRAEKIWSDKDIMMVHDDIWVAVFLGDSVTPLEGTLKKIDANNFTNYYFPSLITGTSFEQYHVREVLVELESGNPVFSSVVTEGTDQITVGGKDNNDQTVSNLYTVSYQQGTATASSSGSSDNIRTDVVTNTRVGGLKIIKSDLQGNPLAEAEFEIRKGEETVGRFSSNGDGLVTTAYLDNGSYTLSETKAPKGYQALTESLSITVNNGEFTISDGDAGSYVYDSEQHMLTVKNIPITLQVVKTDERGNPLDGAHFALYRQVQGTSGPRKDYQPLSGFADIVSGSDGILPGVNISLDVKTYYLTETQAPDDYELPDPVKDVCFTIGSTGITIETGADYTGSIESQRLNTGQSNEYIAYTIRIVNTMEVFPAPSGFKSTTKPYVGMLLMGLAIGLVSFLSRRRRKGEETTEEGMSASTDREDSVLRRAPPGEEKMSPDGNPLCRTGPLEMRLHIARGSPSHTEKEEKTGDKWKEALPIMKNLKALGALLLVVVMLMSLTTAAFAAGVDLGDGEDNSTLGVAGEFTDYDASSPNNTGEGSKQTLVKSVNIKKELLSFNATSTTVYAPAFTYTYTVTPATVTGLTVTDAAAKHASNAAVTVPVKAGITTGLVVTGTEAGEAGSATSAVGTLVFTNNTVLTSSADGKGDGVNTYDINLDFSGVTFPQTGVYRYEIVETLAGGLTYDGIDVKDGGANTLYLDVYVDGTPAIYGYVCMTENASVDPATTTKTNGFVSDGEGAGADSYYTYDLTISKEVVNDNYAKNNIAFPYTVIFNNNGNFTTDYKITETAATGSTGIAPAAGAPTWNGVALVKHGADITYTGIPAGVDVDVYETNISTGVIYSVETSVNNGTPVLDASVTWGTTPADAVAQTNKKDYESTKATVDTTATTAVTAGQTLAITNTLVTISPTGITLRVAPYALMLGIGVLLLVYSRKRKAKVED